MSVTIEFYERYLEMGARPDYEKCSPRQAMYLAFVLLSSDVVVVVTHAVEVGAAVGITVELVSVIVILDVQSEVDVTR